MATISGRGCNQGMPRYAVAFVLLVAGGGAVYAGGVRRASLALRITGLVMMIGWFPLLAILYATGSHD
jgi:hypothetical protein